ncbi:DNA polymerase III subunit delta' [Corynebacterium sp. H113]|uniref:DNA polymerase III subunit delta' n=1 Tax=Corynebacterium sp. H113 TaxID=3133419 RepID=UPI0030A83315
MESYGVFDRVPAAGGVRERLMVAARAAHGHGDSGMTHAWLFTGPPGSGRSVAAEAFAAALLCENSEQPGCGMCHGCQTALAGTHSDLFTVRTEGTIIQVKSVRFRVIPWAYRKPSTAAWRVVIIEDADRLNDQSANALLKAVEEPPERTAFLMCAPTTNPADFSVTLRSRSRHVYVPTPTPEDVSEVLRAQFPELADEQAQWAATVSNGHIGRARGLATDPGTREWRKKALDMVEAVFNPAVSYLRTFEIAASAKAEAERRLQSREEEELSKLEEALGIGARGKGAQTALRGTKGDIKRLEEDQKRRRQRTERDLIDLALVDVMGLFRDAMVVSVGAASGATPLIHIDRGQTAAEIARRVPQEGILECLDAVTDTRNQLGTAVTSRVLLDGLMGQLQLSCRVGVR